MKKIIVISLIFLFTYCSQSNKVFENDPYPHIKMPIYKSAKKIKYNIGKIPNTDVEVKAVQFVIETDFPAMKVIDFYNDSFKKIGFSHYYEDNYGKGNWGEFRDATIHKNIIVDVRQLIKTWINKDRNTRITIVLKYIKNLDDNWNNELFVLCQIQPFYNLNDVKKEFGEQFLINK